MKLRGQELDLWNATYAASMAVLQLDPRLGLGDRYANTCRAIECADEAIVGLRDRRRTGDSRAGQSVWTPDEG